MDIFNNNLRKVNIIETEIDYDDEKFYAEFTNKLSNKIISYIEKEDLSVFIDILNKTNKIIEIKAILIFIVFHASVESFRFLEQYYKKCSSNVKSFACLSLTKSRLIIESKLYNKEDIPVYICSGLGGKEDKLKYFIAYFFQNELKTDEFSFLSYEIKNIITEQYSGDIEEINYKHDVIYFFSYIPINQKIKTICEKIREDIATLYKNELKSVFVCNDKKTIQNLLEKIPSKQTNE